MENELSCPRSGLSSTPCFSGVLRAEPANVNRFDGFRAAASAALDKAAMRPGEGAPNCQAARDHRPEGVSRCAAEQGE